MNSKSRPSVRWSVGTAYDLFTSLHVLHHPDKFGLRPSWAAGVRSRLTVAQRMVLEDSQVLFFNTPIAWILALSEPKDATAVLTTLGSKEPGEILPFLVFHADIPAELLDGLNHIRSSGSWTNADLNSVKTYFQQKEIRLVPEKLVTILKWWANSQEFGERYLEALQAYVEVFFAEEEKRISTYLLLALESAREKAEKMHFTDLMLELSQGVKISALEDAEEVIFAPSYWITPLVMYDTAESEKWLILFGARPSDVALVPGEVIPDAMLRALKALSDPTRLLILHYLNDQPATPSQLARKLRLRAPTVVHHLSALRLAGLVYISMEDEGEKRYTVRSSVVLETFTTLSMFLSSKREQ
jgi:DNA-binding transcriptional ArsR family regulator